MSANCLTSLVVILTGFLTFQSFNLHSQDFIVNSEYFSVENGLSHRDVQSIHQDEKGLIWLGTNYGLNRFDGNRFQWYTSEKDGLQSNMINHIIQDDSGLLWLLFTGNRLFHTPLSIDIFDPCSGAVISIEEKFGEDLPFETRDITSFSNSENGQVAFVTKENKLITYDSRKGYQVHDLEVFPITLNNFSRRNTLWANHTQREGFYKDELIEIDLEGKLIHRFAHNNDFQFNFVGGVDRHDNLWYISKRAKNHDLQGAGFKKGRLHKIDSSRVETEVLIAESSYRTIDFDIPVYANEYNFWVHPDQNTYWLRGLNSFQVFHLGTGWSKELIGDLEFLAHPNVTFFDRLGRGWVGTEFGLYLIEIKSNPFIQIGKVRDQNNIQPFRGITQDHTGQYWACADRRTASLLKFDATGSYEVVAKDESSWAFGFRYGIFTDDAGDVWIGTRFSKSISKYSPDSRTVQSIPYDLPKIRRDQDASIWSFYEDHNKNIWFGSDVGIIGYISDSNEISTLPELKGVNKKGGCIYQFFEDSQGDIWLATDGGLFLLDPDRLQAHPYVFDGEEHELLFLNDGVYHIHEEVDSLGNERSFWLGTRGYGLVNWYPSSGQFERFTRANGLSDNTIYAVYEDDHDNLWLSSDYGIIQFNKNTHQVKAWLEEDGVTNNEFNRISHYKNENGVLFFGGINGITAFHPDDLIEDTSYQNVPLVITNFQQFDGSTSQLVDNTMELNESGKIILHPDDRFFILEFALLEYRNQENVQYAYRVDGVDQQWNYQSESTIRLSRLPYGNHQLRIKGQTSSGHWSQQELAIDLIVVRPIYAQSWFLLLFLAGILLSIYAFYKWRVSSYKRQKVTLENIVLQRTKKISDDKKIIEQQAEELRHLDIMKSRFFANVSHELRTPLTLILGPISSLLKNENNSSSDDRMLQLMEKNGHKLLKYINEILDLNKLESGELDLKLESTLLYIFVRKIISFFFYSCGEEGH